MRMSTVRPQAIYSIQFLRFLAAALVAVNHATWALSLEFPASKELVAAAHAGASGVHLFFVISGFIMVYTVYRDDVATVNSMDFIKRRFIRIFPTYWICLALYLIDHWLRQEPAYEASHVAGALALIPNSLIIGPSWTLSYELYFYCWFAVLLNFRLRTALVAMVVIFTLSMAARPLFSPSANTDVITSSLLIEFMLGALIGFAVLSGKRLSPRLAMLLVICGIGGLIAGTVAASAVRLPSALTWGVPSAALIAGIVFREAAVGANSFVWRTSFLGDSSYSLYLLNVLIIHRISEALARTETARQFLTGDVSVFAASIAITLICIAVSHVFYLFVEKPILRLKFPRQTLPSAGGPLAPFTALDTGDRGVPKPASGAERRSRG